MSTEYYIGLPNDSLNRPVCGGDTPGEKGHWFPVPTGTYGEVDLLFCTLTDTPLTIVPTVYQAPIMSRDSMEITNCEDMTCIAIGTKHPLQFENDTRAGGDICPNATNWGGVHFSATNNQQYFVYADVTTDSHELYGFESGILCCDCEPEW